MQNQTAVLSDSSDASDINNIKAPNVFISPHFRTRTNTARLSFKDFQKKDNPPNLSAAQNPILCDSLTPTFANLFFKKFGNKSNEITNESTTLSAERIVEKEKLNNVTLNKAKSLYHEKTAESFNNEPSIQENTSDKETCADSNNSSLQSPELSSQRTSFLAENKILAHNLNSDTYLDQTSSSLSKNDYPQTDIDEILIEDNTEISKENDKDNVEGSLSLNKNNSDNFLFSRKLSCNSEMKDNLNDDNELNLTIGTIQRWKDEVMRRDCLIEDLRNQIATLRDTLERKKKSLFNYRERMLLVESIIKQKQINTERNRERIDNIKLKYSLFNNLLYNMGNNMEKICNHKERIEGEFESMKSDFSKLTIKYKSTLDNSVATSQAQQDQLVQITEFNSKLIEANAQLTDIITRLRQEIQDTDSKASNYSSELDSILNQLLSEVENEEFKDNRSLIKSNYENEEKIASLTINKIERKIESIRSEVTQLNLIIKEKDERIAHLDVAEKERDDFKVKIIQAKELMKKDRDSLKQEMEIMRAQHESDLKRVESEFCRDRYKLQNDFHKERSQLEAEWREERLRLESERHEERNHRLRLEDEYRDERSERLRIETELRSSERKVEEMSKTNNNDNLRIAQLESQLNKMDFCQPEISTAELETWKSKSSSLESQLISSNSMYNKLREHNKTLVEISDSYLQNKEAVDQALNRTTNYYQDIAKKIAVEHENEIRKRDCKIGEIETKEVSLLEEIQMLKSKLLKMEDSNKSLQNQINEINVENEDSNSKKNEHPSEDATACVLKPISNIEDSRFDLHPHKLLTLTEIDSMILESTSRNTYRHTNINTQSKDDDIQKIQELNNDKNIQYMRSNSNLTETERIVENVTIQAGYSNNNIYDTLQSSNDARDIDDWLSPSSNLRSKRRKTGCSESADKHVGRLHVPSTNTSMILGVKEVSKLETRLRGKSKAGRRTNEKE
ncbi:12467_t:CDS:10 [Funneliformis geosporum]|nr:12467_t:CDS:10 [Funneliformis geosporum]